MKFSTWINTFLSEKEIDLDEEITIEDQIGQTNWLTVGVVVEGMLNTTQAQQNGIKAMLVKIDFKHGNVREYLTYLGVCMANARLDAMGVPA